MLLGRCGLFLRRVCPSVSPSILAPHHGLVPVPTQNVPRRAISQSRVVYAQQYSPRVIALADKISKLNPLEMYILADYIQRRAGASDEMISTFFAGLSGAGISSGAQPAAAAPAAAAVQAEKAPEPVAEKTEFNIKITAIENMEANKFKLIKSIRALKPGEPLDKSKAYITTLPAVFMEAVPKDQAEKIKQELESVGAKIELV